MTDVVATCPCCGGAVDPLALLVDLETNTIASGGFAERVKPQHAEFAHALLKAYPRAVTVDALRTALWGMGNEPDASLMSIRVAASRVRAVARGMGF